MAMNKRALRPLATAAAVAALLLTPVWASAAPSSGSWYTGLQAGWTNLDFDRRDDVDFLMATARVGFFPVDQVAIETRFGVGVSDDDMDNVDYSVDHMLGLYAVGHVLNYRDAFSFYLIGGLTSATLEANGNQERTDYAPAFGLGFDVYLHSSMALNLEYIRNQNGADPDGAGKYDLSSMNVGLTWYH